MNQFSEMATKRYSDLIINPHKFDYVVTMLRNFFSARKFIEVHTQNRLSILAACEDPTTISTFKFAGEKYPLPQTGQMWLEYEMLKNPKPPGYYCVSTSYRNEKVPIIGRHNLVFPMFEFEMHGGIDSLQKMEISLLDHLGYGTLAKKRYTDAIQPIMPCCKASVPIYNILSDSPKNSHYIQYGQGYYIDVDDYFGVSELTHEHEMRLYKENGFPAFLLKNFPEVTSPFWNMKRNVKLHTANKIDVILSGQETIGSAERETNRDLMRERFNTISGGEYAKLLYALFGTKRVNAELDEFLGYDFIPRSGGGIGITRLIRSMEMEGLFPKDVIDASIDYNKVD